MASAVPPPPPPSAAGTSTGPKPRSGRRWLVPVLVVAAVVVAAVVVAVVLSGDDGPAAIDTAPIVEVLDDVDAALDDDRDTAADSDQGMYVELSTCPSVDLDDAWNLAPEGIEPIEDPQDPVAFASTVTDDADEPILLQCSQATEVGDGESAGDGRISGTVVGHASERSHRSYVSSSFDGFDIDFGDTTEHRGGEIVTYCVAPERDLADDFAPFCEADWVNEEVQIGVYVTVDPDDLPLVQEWLVASLDVIVDGVIASGGEIERAD